MGDLFKMLVALTCVFCLSYFVTTRGGLDKTKMVKNSEASGFVYIKRVLPIGHDEKANGVNYPFKVEAELLKPITGSLPNYMILYMQKTGPSGSADLGTGRAVVFVNKDLQGRLTLEKGSQDVFAVKDNHLWWSSTNKFMFVREMPLQTVIKDIRKIAVGKPVLQKSL